MTRALASGVFCVAVAVGCGRGPAAGPAPTEEQQVMKRTDTKPLKTLSGARPAPVNVVGCLTASGDRFVLTQLRRADTGQTAEATAPSPTTDMYQLVNADDQLRALVHKEVRIGGEAEAPTVTQFRESVPSTGTGRDEVGTSGSQTPKVAVQESARIQMRRMSVLSVTPTGDDCQKAGATTR
jgi:hypothetical protein